jgi:hypothetical protein
MAAVLTPGVYRTDAVVPTPAALATGVPAFLGLATAGAPAVPVALRAAGDFAAHFGASPAAGCLGAAVDGFFVNGGEVCHVVRVDEQVGLPLVALQRGLDAIADIDEVDLVCLPDASRLRRPGELAELAPDPLLVGDLQRAVVAHCEAVGTRMAILDALPAASADVVLKQRAGLRSANAALYHPWLLVESAGARRFVPPCGHVAGVYAATDRAYGPHKAPANEILRGVLDLQRAVDDRLGSVLNPASVNCLRAFAGRGIRIWGARTLSSDPAWTYVNVRRLVLSTARWIDANLGAAVFEPDDERLWARLRRELAAYLTGLYRAGALSGASTDEAFYVRCDETTNAGRPAGHVTVEVGLAALAPSEFIVVHFVHEPGGVSVAGPNSATPKEGS